LKTIETSSQKISGNKKRINNFQCAYTEIWPIEKLNPHPENKNIHPKEQVELLAKVIDYQGQRLAVKVSKESGYITAGHCRLSSIKELGWTEVAVDLQSYEDKAQEIADLNADNLVAELARTDERGMIESIKELNLDQTFDLELFGLPGLQILDPKIIEEVNKGDENAEWSEMPEFKEGEKYIKVILHFKTEEERSAYVEENEIHITMKKSDQWIAHI
jgi:hypothetical protein